MSIFTYADAKSYSRSIQNESIKIAQAQTKSLTRDVFLSHSSKDSEYIVGIIAFLEEQGASVYVDLGDDRLPSNPNPKTATILKAEIQSSPRFIVLVSPNSKDSKWIPWELGLSDGAKGLQYSATFPIGPTADREYWITQEYLGIYPRIELIKAQGESTPSWCVWDPRDGKYWPLKVWLKGSIS